MPRIKLVLLKLGIILNSKGGNLTHSCCVILIRVQLREQTNLNSLFPKAIFYSADQSEFLGQELFEQENVVCCERYLRKREKAYTFISSVLKITIKQIIESFWFDTFTDSHKLSLKL